MNDGHDVAPLFERVVNKHYDDAPSDWHRVLAILNMDPIYQPAVAEVLREGRWRRKDDPKAYAATASYRLARGWKRKHGWHLIDHVDQSINVYVRKGCLTEPTTVDSRPTRVDSRFHKRGKNCELIDTLTDGSYDLKPSSDPVFFLPIEDLELRQDAWERGRLFWPVESGGSDRPTLSRRRRTPVRRRTRKTLPAWLGSDGVVEWQRLAAAVAPRSSKQSAIGEALHERFDSKFFVRSVSARDLVEARRWLDRNWDRVVRVMGNLH